MKLKEVVGKIEEMARSRMCQQEVVSLDQFRGSRKLRKQTILVIDDDPTIRVSLKRVFESEGYKVCCIEDGTHLSSIVNEPIDFIILDIGLPWVNGYELADVLKQSEDLQNIPMIFLSSHTEEESIKKGFDKGADDYIKKPFDINNLKNTVKILLARDEDELSVD